MLNVNQHWDPLKICIVGKAHDPGSLTFVDDTRIRNVLDRIAAETEEDFQNLIKVLESFGVEVLRPKAIANGKKPPVAPRDYTGMIGNKFFIDIKSRHEEFTDICEYIKSMGNEIIYDQNVHTDMVLRLGKDLICADVDLQVEALSVLSDRGLIDFPRDKEQEFVKAYAMIKGDEAIKNHRSKNENLFPEHRITILNEGGHIDGYIFPLRPGLLIAADYISDEHRAMFKDWEIITVNKFNIDDDPEFRQFQVNYITDWAVNGQKVDSKFVDFVETYMRHWVGCVEETYFNVNTLIIDQNNVVCINFPDNVLRSYEACGITPHAVRFRHRFFWDGGIHCITSDIHREGPLVDHKFFSD